MAKEIVELKPKEEIVGLVRKSLLAHWRRIFFILFWLLLPFFFFFPLLTLGPFGFAFFVAMFLSGLLYAVRRWRMWRNTVFLITDRRLIDVDQVGFFTREVSEVEYEDIKEVQVIKKGLVKRLFRVGAVRVQTRKILSYDLYISGVRRPEHVAELINEVQSIQTREVSGETFHAKKISS